MARWENLNTAFENVRTYIEGKSDKFKLTIEDLLYISNFKGGNASILERADTVNSKLEKYSKSLRSIAKDFESMALGQLSPSQKESFREMAQDFVELPLHEETAIKGFGPSYASALLCAYFPRLAPILDRNVLAGARIEHKISADKQVIGIQNHYRDLIDFFHRRLSQNPQLTLRELDQQLFEGAAQ